MDINQMSEEEFLLEEIKRRNEHLSDYVKLYYEYLNNTWKGQEEIKKAIEERTGKIPDNPEYMEQYNRARKSEMAYCLKNIECISKSNTEDISRLSELIKYQQKSFFQDIADDMKEMMNYVKNAPEYLVNKWKSTIEKFNKENSKTKEPEKEIVQKKPKAKLVSRPKADNSNTFHR